MKFNIYLQCAPKLANAHRGREEAEWKAHFWLLRTINAKDLNDAMTKAKKVTKAPVLERVYE